jgi:hypothetical protein
MIINSYNLEKCVEMQLADSAASDEETRLLSVQLLTPNGVDN